MAIDVLKRFYKKKRLKRTKQLISHPFFRMALSIIAMILLACAQGWVWRAGW